MFGDRFHPIRLAALKRSRFFTSSFCKREGKREIGLIVVMNKNRIFFFSKNKDLPPFRSDKSVRVGFKKGKCVSPFFSVALEVETSSKKRIEQIDFSFQRVLRMRG